ncbi:MAG: glycerol-3-phosphate acyltransferase [Elainella sp.]
MTFLQLWGALLIFVLCPLLGGLPLIGWIVKAATGQDLRQVGTGNISVSAAFYHGGRWVGVLAVLSEALKGILAVLLARYYFPANSEWEIIALIMLVMGRYWVAKGAGTTNVVWGYLVHDPITAGLTALIGGIGFTLLREKTTGRLGVLALLPLLTAIRHPNSGRLQAMTLILSLLIGWIYQKIPDDLDLPPDRVQSSSSTMFRFFRGDRALLSLDQPLRSDRVGAKAATLSQLLRWGYPVPFGWVLAPGDEAAPLIAALDPAPDRPLVVRSSALGEDSEAASAAGQYESYLYITSRPALEQAILRCQASYSLPNAQRYRQERGLEGKTGMAVLVQTQVQGLVSGVAFSRDPISRQGEAVVVEALPGMATGVVSGQTTPAQYRVWIDEEAVAAAGTGAGTQDWRLPEGLDLPVEQLPVEQLPVEQTHPTAEIPLSLIQQVAYLARQLEARYHGLPQDIEWSYDGEQLWLLQARPITTLLPIWTRKIAAEVIPGFIHPLTWSINRPLTCGVWGEIFSIVLGDRARGLNFEATATLHRSAAYFNASLLGEIFRRMGLPPESLEFLTRGAKFSKPPLTSTLRNLPGLLRLAGAEWRLETEFNQEQSQFEQGFAALAQQPVDTLAPEALLARIEQILALLKRATYYSILAPLSAALRQAILKVDQTSLDSSAMPEVAAIRALQAIAQQPEAAQPQQLAEFLQTYGYLSEVGTDIAVATWREDPGPVEALLHQFRQSPPASPPPAAAASSWKTRQAQRRLSLKGRVTACYSQLLAELRWSFVALENHWLKSGLLHQPGDLFFLNFAEVQQLVAAPTAIPDLPELIAQRRRQLDQDRQLTPPWLVYGNSPPAALPLSPVIAQARLQGIPASPGQVEGEVLVLRDFQNLPAIDRNKILVVPYTDSGWAVLLARAGGLIAEVGGQLSHGAIVAREYGIPAVMNLPNATQVLQTGQRVRLDGATGVVEVVRDLIS